MTQPKYIKVYNPAGRFDPATITLCVLRTANDDETEYQAVSTGPAPEMRKLFTDLNEEEKTA